MKIGIIGSGIAGLSAAWLFNKHHDVTIFDRQSSLGMDAFSLDVEHQGKTIRLDVPMRLSYAGYYKNLLAMYGLAGIKTQHIKASGSFSTLDGKTYAKFRNISVAGLNLPRFTGQSTGKYQVPQMILDGMKYAFNAPRQLQNGMIPRAQTFEEYFKARGFSDGFIDGVMMPMYAVMCTCSYDAIRNYPAEVIIDNLKPHMFFSGFQQIRRVVNGTQEVVKRLSYDVKDIRLNTTIESITRTPEGKVLIKQDDGTEHLFDHVLLGTQANHATKLLTDATPTEKEMLSSFTYEPCEVVIHSDDSLMPPRRADWGAINFIVDPNHQYPYSTGWMNGMHPDLKPDAPPIFHTLNPQVEIDPKKEIDRAWFERPIVTQQSLAALDTLNQLHREADRNVWFIGSYAAYGIPLQESAVKSSVNVAHQLGVRIPWERQ